MTSKHIEDVYNAYAGVYDVVFGQVFSGGRVIARDLLELFPGSKMLEVGVGTGLSIPDWCPAAEFVGVDLSQKMLDQAQKRVTALGMQNVRLLKMDANALEFPDQCFDRVLAAYFISTVPDPVGVIREMKRVCRPGGYLVFCNHFQSTNPLIGLVEKAISPVCYRLGFRTDLKLRGLMAAAGLEIEWIENIDSLGIWKAVRCVNP